MIDTIIKNDNKHKLSVEDLLNEVYLLPKWEKIKTFSLTQKRFLFGIKSFNVNVFRKFSSKNQFNVNVFRKFSSKNQLEKYSIRTDDEKILANMDLKVYKDSVYIINLNFDSQTNFEPLIDKMLQIAIEKALYNTSDKKVIFNLTSGMLIKNKIRKILIANEFKQEENQSSYEKEMFGETFCIDIDNSSVWMKKIKQMPILINK